MHNIKKSINIHLEVWWILARNALQETFINRWSNLLFIFGKVVRLIMNLVVLFLIKNTISTFAGYTSDQMVVFFLTYQFIDTITQIFYRGVYNFSSKIENGELDMLLVKPVSTLFQSLVGQPDFNDALIFLPTIAVLLFVGSQLDISITPGSFALYLLLLVNAFIIATAIHIIILVVGVLSTTNNGVTWLYRDMMDMARYPVTAYLEPIRSILFFVIPVGIMITIPSQILINTKPSFALSTITVFGVLFFAFSFKLWGWSLKRYSSASS